MNGRPVHTTHMKACENWSEMCRQVICVVEGESGTARLAHHLLSRNSVDVQSVACRPDELKALEELRPSAIIIEVNGADSGGVELCRSIRRHSTLAWLPIILVSGDRSEEECVQSLDSGADDFIPELSAESELLARVRAVQRRFARGALQSGHAYPSTVLFQMLAGSLIPLIRIGDLEIDLNSMRVVVRGREITITALEFRLIFYLVQHIGRVFTRDELLDAVWGTRHQDVGSLKACVRRLREKIELDPKRPLYLKTVRGVGYALDAGGSRLVRRSDDLEVPLGEPKVDLRASADFC